MRLSSTDMLLGCAMIGVVFIHAGSMFGESWRAIAEWYRWGVPVFIVYGSMFATMSLARHGAAKYINKRLIRLGVPFIAYSLLYYLLLRGDEPITVVKLFTRHWSGYGWAGQYFFVIMIQLAVIWPLIGKLRPSTRVTAATVIGSLLLAPVLQSAFSVYSPIAKIGDRPVVYWLPYILLGLWLSSHWPLRFTWIDKRPTVAVLLLICCPILIPLEGYAWSNSEFSGGSIYLRASTILAGCCWALLGPQVIDRLAGRVSLRSMGIVGYWSLGVFCLNPLVIYMLAGLCNVVGFEPNGITAFLSPIWGTAFVLALCLLLCKALHMIGLSLLAR